MRQVWGFYLLFIGILLQSLLHASGIIKNDYILVIFILLSLVFFAYNLMLQFPQRLHKFIIVASIIRFLIMLWNVYGRDTYLLIGVGTDTEGFYHSADLISKNLALLNMPIYGEYYSKYLGLLFSLTGSSYLLGSYLNYLYGLFAIRFLNDILKDIIDAKNTAYTVGILLFVYAPINMILCSSLRRESIIILFVLISLKMLFQWLKTAKISYAVLSIVFLLISSIFHAGIVGLFLGYVFLFLFYDPQKHSHTFSFKTVASGVLILMTTILIITQYSSVFLNKLIFEDEDILLNRMARARGGAAYLSSLQISSFQSALLYAPLKAFYFLFSPVPWDWRNLSDAVAFLLDSLVYFLLVVGVLINFKNSRYPAKWAVNLSFLGGLFIYAMGSQNAATAMRHRCKLLALLIILFCILKGYNDIKNSQDSDMKIGV